MSWGVTSWRSVLFAAYPVPEVQVSTLDAQMPVEGSFMSNSLEQESSVSRTCSNACDPPEI